MYPEIAVLEPAMSDTTVTVANWLKVGVPRLP